MWKEVRAREEGALLPKSFAVLTRRSSLAALHLSNHKEIVSPHGGAVNSIEVDQTEGRYLLSGASDGSVAAYDIQQPTEYEAGGCIAKHKNLFVIDKQHSHGHEYAVSSVLWYPVDTGLFVTGSVDRYVRVWDTNTNQVVRDFKLPGKVYATAMSPIAHDHMLIAAGSEDVQVRLCDIESGMFTHTLSGHKDGILTLEWSTSSEWVLMSGGSDGAIRFWDIRRAGCFLVLDQSRSQLGRRPPLSSNASQNVSRRTPTYTTNLTANKAVFSPTKDLAPSKGQISRRLHPGMYLSQNRAMAHYGAVTCLRATKDGMYLISSGSDSRLRLWDVESGCNTLVNFNTGRLQTSKPLQLAVDQDNSLVFVPCMSIVKAYDVWSGFQVRAFRGHYESTNCCFFNTQDQELYSGGNDRQILIWSSTKRAPAEEEEDGKRRNTLEDTDDWSD